MQRLAKAMSNSGVCSRREAERLILAGEVKLDGIRVISPAINVNDQSVIEVLGKIIRINPTPRLWMYYKPLGLITTHKDTHGRETVFENLPNLPRVISIGRLDLNSEGLLLLTNNGDLARRFELPSSKLERVYKVRAYGDPTSLNRYCERTEASLRAPKESGPSLRASPLGRVRQSREALLHSPEIASLSTKARNDESPHEITTVATLLRDDGLPQNEGIVIDNICYNPKSIKLIKAGRVNSWFEVVLTEGKNREIRKIFEHFGLKVNRLIRIRYGSFILGSLKPGEYKEQVTETFKNFLPC